MGTHWIERPLSGKAYFLWGAGLSALKLGVDAAIAHAFHHPFALLYYVDPVDAPLFHPGQATAFWVSLMVATLPFMAIGVALTSRRLHDAHLSQWLSLLFFVPFANLLFFLVASLVPSQGGSVVTTIPEQAVYRQGAPAIVSPPIPVKRYSVLLAGALSAVPTLGAIAISVGLLGQYGVGLILGTPTFLGFVAASFFVRLRPLGSLGGAFGAATIGILVSAAVLISFALEGFLCLSIILPIAFVMAMPGVLIGFYVGRGRRMAAAMAVAATGFLVALGAQELRPLPSLEPEAVETSIEIDAPPSRVWEFVPALADMPKATGWPFAEGVAYPVRVQLDAPRVGATRRCEFTTGIALETVDVWSPGERLGFTIDSQPDPMVEQTIYHSVRQPHLNGYVRNSRGELSLEPLPGGRTRVTARSWYAVRLAPERYFRLWADHFVHAIHGRVLGVIKARSEAPPGGSLFAGATSTQLHTL